jgi:class 3 adenylate cyclase/tetratricopeptide (TPR) repeat protein
MSFSNVDEISECLRTADVPARQLYLAWDQRLPIADVARRKIEAASIASAKQIDWIRSDLDLARRFVEHALRCEEFLLVCDAAREAMAYWSGRGPDDAADLIQIRIDYARALTRLGSTRLARELLEPCVASGSAPILGKKLRARILLELGNVQREKSYYAPSRSERQKTAEEALVFYKRALELDRDDLEAQVLTAAAGFVLGEPGGAQRAEAREIANQIIDAVKKREETAGPRVLTTRATATAHSVLDDADSAWQAYARLKDLPGATTSELANARHYARYLAEAMNLSREHFSSAFPPLQIVVFEGHLPDLPGAPKRFPIAAIEQVRQQIKARLDELKPRVCMASGAAGSSLLFVDEVLNRGGAVHVVLPWTKEEFLKTTVLAYETSGAPAVWEPMFQRAIEQAETVREIHQSYLPSSSVGWVYTMEVSAGLALHSARMSRLDVQPLVLWDQRAGRGPGGTENFVKLWESLGRPPQIIPLAATDSGPISITTDGFRSERQTLNHTVKSMLFADIVGYSRLTEQVIPDFVETFMERVSQLAASSKHAPRSLNTWGDAVYAVFDYAHDAGCFAMELIQMVKEGEDEWLRRGLYWEEQVGDEKRRRPLNVRIGLHTGPVFMHFDPIVRRLGFTGAHVNRAARIEPVAEPGEAFASMEFAALAELDAETRRVNRNTARKYLFGFNCEYAGSMQLAKHFPGRFRIYRVVAHRVFGIEELAQAAHAAYCDESLARGETPATNNAIRPWEDLPDDLKEANRAQVADIPNKLRYLGYELAPSHGLLPSQIRMIDAQVEELSIIEHDRWMNNRIEQGWTFGPQRDNLRKLHPLIVPWEELSEPEKEKDRDTVRNMPKLIEKAGFRVRAVTEKK